MRIFFSIRNNVKEKQMPMTHLFAITRLVGPTSVCPSMSRFARCSPCHGPVFEVLRMHTALVPGLL